LTTTVLLSFVAGNPGVTGISIVPVWGSPPVLGLGTSAFECQPAFVRHPRRFGFLTRPWLVTGLAYQLDQALQCILPVAFTDAETVGLDRENTCVAHPSAGEANQSPFDGCRHGSRAPDVEPQLDGGCDLVDLLTTGTGGTDEAFLELRIVEADAWGDGDHASTRIHSILHIVDM